MGKEWKWQHRTTSDVSCQGLKYGFLLQLTQVWNSSIFKLLFLPFLLHCGVYVEPGEREDPEIPHHLGVHQQTPPGSVLLVIPVSELIPAARNWGGGKKQLYFSCRQFPAKQEDGLGGFIWNKVSQHFHNKRAGWGFCRSGWQGIIKLLTKWLK